MTTFKDICLYYWLAFLGFLFYIKIICLKINHQGRLDRAILEVLIICVNYWVKFLRIKWTKQKLTNELSLRIFVSRIFMNYVQSTGPNFLSPSIKRVIKLFERWFWSIWNIFHIFIIKMIEIIEEPFYFKVTIAYNFSRNK